MELATLGLFSAMLLVCVVLEKSVLWALAAGFVLFFCVWPAKRLYRP